MTVFKLAGSLLLMGTLTLTPALAATLPKSASPKSASPKSASPKSASPKSAPPVSTPSGSTHPAPAPPRAVVERLLRTQIEQIWGRGEIARIDQTYAPTVVDHMPVAGQHGGLRAMKQVVRAFRTGLPDMKLVLHHVLVKGDYGVDHWTLTATNRGPLFGAPATGKPVQISGIDFVRVDQGRIVDLWHVEEIAQLRAQLGTQAAAVTPAATPAATAQVVQAPTQHGLDPGARAQLPDAALLTPIERRNLAIARRHIEEIWAKGNVSAAYELYAGDVVDHNPAPTQRPGIAGIVDVLGWLRASVPNLTMSIERYLVDGDFAVDRWTMRGTHTGAPLMGIAATNKPFLINGMDVIRIRPDGLISDVWHVEEFDSLRQQISGHPQIAG